MVSRLQLPPEIQLAQRLAGNEQVTRDRAVRKLRKYIVARTQRAAGGFTHDELLKVWKGLFYCMWMQDKPLLQEELGRTISQLVHAFQTTEAQHLFLQAFWQTMNREWTGIDRLRLDKFYMLMRMVLNESLKVLKMRGWEERQIEELLELLTSEILHPSSQAPHGVKSHFIEIFLEELTKVGAEELTADQNLKFIDPFCRIAARTKDSLVLNNITRGIFETIVEQAPLAIEDLLNELDAQDGEVVSDSEESSEGSERGDALSQKRSEKPPAGSVCRAEPEAGEQTGDDRDSGGPVLQFDYEAVANRLFEMASRQSTPSQNRKRLYKVVRKWVSEGLRLPCCPWNRPFLLRSGLQDLAGGIFPEDEIPEKACRRLLEGRRQKKTKKQKRLLRLQRERGKDEKEPPSLGMERKRSKRRGVGADPKARAEAGEQPGTAERALLRDQPRDRGQRGARQRRRTPRQPAGARAKAANVQEPEKKKKRGE
ncbi:PREDICTED: ribosomal RNA processing protein 1 homolog A isoform X1 [Rhinopithecus bieti]|uniref:ribosomal RNA processing protein 1 homolog A isoform X1 n=1 Tax=Rhinopithecus bieti TaxID=61621 RepID=UPI00083BDD70|nr:PREDICTED: ribosomal RNA processing protein 1 homolog A isoform X1 [Rhinopithecus bieti]